MIGERPEWVFYFVSGGEQMEMSERAGKRMDLMRAAAPLAKTSDQLSFLYLPARFSFLSLFAATTLMAIFESRKWRN